LVDGRKIVGQGQKTGNGAEDRGKGGNGWLERNEDGRKEDEDTELSRQGQKRGVHRNKDGESGKEVQ
jgi:hypothetical protein